MNGWVGIPTHHMLPESLRDGDVADEKVGNFDAEAILWIPEHVRLAKCSTHSHESEYNVCAMFGPAIFKSI